MKQTLRMANFIDGFEAYIYEHGLIVCLFVCLKLFNVEMLEQGRSITCHGA